MGDRIPLRSKSLENSLRNVAGAIRQTEAGHGARWLFYCAVVGVIAGIAALGFDVISNFSVHLFLEQIVHWSPPRPGGEHPMFGFDGGDRRLWLLALMPAVGGLISGAIVYWLAPEASGHGTDAVINAYHRRDGVIRLRVPFVKILASAITLGSGGSGGREGPIAQVGAGFGSFIATRLRLSIDDRRILLAAGMGAGIGSIFRAPLAGALFATEILYSSAEFEASVLIPACVSSIIAYSVFTLVHGTGTLFQTPTMSFEGPVELAGYFALAVVLVIYGIVYVRVLYGTHDLFHRWRFPTILKPAVGGLFTGVLAVLLLWVTANEESLSVLGFGYGVVQHALDAPSTAILGAGLLALIAFGKIVTTATTIGSGGSAGVFGPSVVIGGCAGGAVGLALHQLAPSLAPHPAAFVVVGMAGFFAGIAKTPISSLVMVSEITGSYSLLIPSMWVCVLTFAMSRGKKLYSMQVASRVDSPAHQGRFATDVLRGLKVSDAVALDGSVRCLRTNDPLSAVLRVAASADQATFPVLDEKGELTGVISLDQVRRVMNENLPDQIIAHDLMVTSIPRLAPGDDLADALRALTEIELEELPVWDTTTHRVVGLISHKQLTRTYVERMAWLRQARTS